ncbi:hypothetical protein BDV38DRAFT_241017 [Aspergillus pseudotamarii]|uniref:Uncharacterized protein n=1 Tax=Aspergillus pseudotamarii TaxID=132259 RepID=A0A5N6SZQ3_ASPPS|nr:uncharacterized protein BDV38DRAFT_241017 [Aspergillus pseudotamarii]KAE8140112.1 hypothetical protein BDV38DRAFT_241017 [Aspergillus pseudotamarii]
MISPVGYPDGANQVRQCIRSYVSEMSPKLHLSVLFGLACPWSMCIDINICLIITSTRTTSFPYPLRTCVV